MEKHTLESALKRIKNLENSRWHYKTTAENLVAQNTGLSGMLEKSRLKEHEALEKAKALDESMKKIAEIQVLQKQSYENMERQFAQSRESATVVLAENNRLVALVDSEKHRLASLISREKHITTRQRLIIFALSAVCAFQILWDFVF